MLKTNIISLFLLFFLSMSIHAEDNIANLVETEDLLRSLAYNTDKTNVKIYHWKIESNNTSLIKWDEGATTFTDKGFERKGDILLGNHGKITHHTMGTEVENGKWELFLYGDTKRIIRAEIKPNAITQEKPVFDINKIYIQDSIACKDAPESKIIFYLIKLPGKELFWMTENTTISSKGSASSYIISYDQKPVCAYIPQTKTVEKNNEQQISMKKEAIEQEASQSTASVASFRVGQTKTVEKNNEQQISMKEEAIQQEASQSTASVASFRVGQTKTVEKNNEQRFSEEEAIEQEASQSVTSSSYLNNAQIKTFLLGLLRSGCFNSIQDVSYYYSDDVTKYFSFSNPSHRAIYDDNVKSCKRWSYMNYTLISFNIINNYAFEGMEYADIRVKISFEVSNSKKSSSGISIQDMTLVEEGGKIKIKSSIGRTSKSSVSKQEIKNDTKYGLVYGLDPNGDGFLSIRAGASGNAVEIDRLYNGETVTILKRQGKWYKIQSNRSGVIGWAHSNWIMIQ